MTRISVLVAAYNAAESIGVCLKSLCTQTHTDVQILCVDDASTDHTPQLLDEWSQQDSRITVTHLPENRGQAYARNIALEQADGDFICMLDSDDWFAPDALEQAAAVFAQHPETDCVLFQVVEVTEGKQRHYPLPDFEVMTGEEAFEASLTWQLHGLYMVRAALHKQNPYDDSSRAYSDDNTTRIHYLLSRQVRVCQGIYYYLQHPDSVTHQVSVRRFDYLRANESMRRQMLQHGVGQRLLDTYENVRWLNLIDLYMFWYQHRRQLSDDDSRYGLSEMRRVWGSIDTACILPQHRRKFGYMPLRCSWWLFRCQEEVYFFLRFLIKGR